MIDRGATSDLRVQFFDRPRAGPDDDPATGAPVALVNGSGMGVSLPFGAVIVRLLECKRG